MAKLNSSYISDLQSTSLEEKIESSKNSVDLYYEGYDRNSNIAFEQYGKYAHINRVLLWLSTKPRDYVRSSFTGGILYSLLGQLGNDTNLKSWENDIREKFNEEFFQIRKNRTIIALLLREENPLDMLLPLVDNVIMYNYYENDKISDIENYTFEDYQNLINKLDFTNYCITEIRKKEVKAPKEGIKASSK